MTVEPRFWIAIKPSGSTTRNARPSPGGSSGDRQVFALHGYGIHLIKNHGETTSVAPGSPCLFDCGTSDWLRQTLQDYELEDTPESMSGTLTIESADAFAAGLRTTRDHRTSEPVAHLKVRLSLALRVECVSCLENFRQKVEVQEEWRVHTPTTRAPSAASKKPSGQREDADEMEGEPLNNEALEIYELKPQGLALDEILVDAIECALPDYPRCPGCAEGLMESELN